MTWLEELHKKLILATRKVMKKKFEKEKELMHFTRKPFETDAQFRDRIMEKIENDNSRLK